MMLGKYRTTSAHDTIDLGIALGQEVADGGIFCLFGDLAAGKTTFIKGFVHGALGIAVEEINSPTFTYLNIYEKGRTVYHFDLYRIPSSEEFIMMGFDDYLESPGICCIEWSEHIVDILPPACYSMRFSHCGENNRTIVVEQ